MLLTKRNIYDIIPIIELHSAIVHFGGDMRYNNYTNDAIYELERQRTYNYGVDYEREAYDDGCEQCGSNKKTIFKINSHMLCEDCACNALRDSFEDFEPTSYPFGIDAERIFKQITDDFSDSELLSYIENVYEKI